MFTESIITVYSIALDRRNSGTGPRSIRKGNFDTTGSSTCLCVFTNYG